MDNKYQKIIQEVYELLLNFNTNPKHLLDHLEGQADKKDGAFFL